jgi:hypothetical protein
MLGKIQNAIKKDKRWIILIAIFSVFLFLRFYQIDSKTIFLTDQVDNAWAAKKIIVDHNFPLTGPSNKLGSGLYVGPLYYYFVAVFYYFTNLDPIASGLIAGFTSIIGFITLFYVTKKLFSFNVALIAILINTVAFSGIQFDRTQWEVNFIPIVSLLAFYFLYRILSGNEKSILWLSIILALSFHVHITVAVFLPIITLISLPFFPKNKKTLRYVLLSIPIFLIFLAPIIITNLQSNNFFAANAGKYAQSTFHGIHLRRIFQLNGGAFFQLETFLTLNILRFLRIALLPIFFIVYLRDTLTKRKFTMIALVTLWFIVPWIVLSGYSGEITDYYFSTNRYIGLFVIAYLLVKLLQQKKIIITSIIAIFGIYYGMLNLQAFFKSRTTGLNLRKTFVKQAIKEGKIIPYKNESPESYIYYIYTRKK